MNENDKLREAINATESWNPEANMDFVRSATSWNTVLAAAKAHLAEQEAKRPKRANLRELADLQSESIASGRWPEHLEDRDVRDRMYQQSADILRALDDTVVPWLKSSAWTNAWSQGKVICINGLTAVDILRALGESP